MGSHLQLTWSLLLAHLPWTTLSVKRGGQGPGRGKEKSKVLQAWNGMDGVGGGRGAAGKALPLSSCCRCILLGF